MINNNYSLFRIKYCLQVIAIEMTFSVKVGITVGQNGHVIHVGCLHMSVQTDLPN